jgi:hypothetical protein
LPGLSGPFSDRQPIRRDRRAAVFFPDPPRIGVAAPGPEPDV